MINKGVIMNWDKLEELVKNNKRIEIFKDELSLIHNPTIEKITINALNNTDKSFFTESSSINGKYHSIMDNGINGLLRHTGNCVFLANEMFKIKYYNELFNRVQKDLIISALILHDSGDNSDYKHELKKPKFDEKDALEEYFGNEIFNLIKTHSGQWGPIYPKNEMELFVHQIDYLCSRKYIEIYPYKQ